MNKKKDYNTLKNIRFTDVLNDLSSNIKIDKLKLLRERKREREKEREREREREKEREREHSYLNHIKS